MDGGVQNDADLGGVAFALEHGGDVVGGAVAEELAEGLFVIGNSMRFDETDEIGGRVAGERGFAEMGIGGEEVFGAAMEVGEVAAASAGDEDFLAGAFGVIEHGEAAPALAGFDGAHQAGGAGAENDGVKRLGHGKDPRGSGSFPWYGWFTPR